MSYSSISIVVPDTAEQGKIITAAAHVTNITANYYPFKVKIYAVQDIYAVPKPGELIASFEQAIEGGETKHYGAVFTMPAWDTTIVVMVHVFTDSYWYYDTHATKVVSLGAAPPVKYTEITEIIAPASAVLGDTVDVEVKVKNLCTFDITISITGKSDETILSFGPSYSKVASGQVRSYMASFVMPNKDVEVSVGSFFWGVDDEWHSDDTAQTTVSITEGPPTGFELIRDEKYPLASTYYGNAERSTVTFSVVAPSFMISSDKVDQMVTSFEDKFVEEGAHMLEFKLYEKRGLVQSDYSADIVTTLPETSGQAVVPTILGISTGVFIAIIIAVCLIVGLIIILVVRKDVNQFLFGTPPTDEEPGVPGMVDLIGNMMVIMMMIMMMEIMGPMLAPEGAPPRPKPVTEAAVRAARVAAKAAVKAVPVGVKAVKEVTKRF